MTLETSLKTTSICAFPGGGHGNPLQYSCLENPVDRGAWQATVHRAAQSGTQLEGVHAQTHTYML